MKTLSLVLSHFLSLGVTIVGIAVLIYIPLQYTYRESLNDPQVAMTRDAQSMLLAGVAPHDVVNAENLYDVRTSLSPFTVIYDKDGKPLASSALYGDGVPVPPVSVLLYAKEHGEHRLTWQPEVDTRIALVIRYVETSKGEIYYVLAGRNMEEGERRISVIGGVIVSATCLLLIIAFFFDYMGHLVRMRQMSKNT